MGCPGVLMTLRRTGWLGFEFSGFPQLFFSQDVRILPGSVPGRRCRPDRIEGGRGHEGGIVVWCELAGGFTVQVIV